MDNTEITLEQAYQNFEEAFQLLDLKFGYNKWVYMNSDKTVLTRDSNNKLLNFELKDEDKTYKRIRIFIKANSINDLSVYEIELQKNDNSLIIIPNLTLIKSGYIQLDLEYIPQFGWRIIERSHNQTVGGAKQVEAGTASGLIQLPEGSTRNQEANKIIIKEKIAPNAKEGDEIDLQVYGAIGIDWWRDNYVNTV